MRRATIFLADHPFQFFIRDNASSTFLFMGRMNDPTQSENELAPSVARIPGDSNHDGRFNSTDLVLAFQSGKYEDGIAGNANFAQGDWNGDGDFTTADLVFAFQSSVYEDAPAARLPLQQIAATLFSLDKMEITRSAAKGKQGSERAFTGCGLRRTWRQQTGISRLASTAQRCCIGSPGSDQAAQGTGRIGTSGR